MVQGAVFVLIVGFIAGVLAERLRLPRLLGMLLAGVVFGPYVLNLISPQLLDVGNEIRMLALVVILLKAGLGLDKKKILAQGTTSIRLGIIPCSLEAAVLAVATHFTLGWSWVISWLLAWIICAESPAVLVPMMLRLKSEGWGVKSGLPDLVLAGGALSDVVAITVFGIVLDMASSASTPGWASLLAIPIQVIGGLVVGFIGGKLITRVLCRTSLTENAVQDLIVALVVVVTLVMFGDKAMYSGYLAAMAAGFIILDSNEILARRIRAELDRVWTVAEIFLFVLIGAAVNISVVVQAGGIGVLLLALGLLLGRVPAIWLATSESTLSSKEKIFMNVGYVAKATVQAAIGALPLSLGLPHGETILAFAVLAIVITAPIGAVGTALLAPRLLERGEVDPTKVTVKEKYRFLVAFDQRGRAMQAFREAARMARQVDATIMVLHVDENGQTSHEAGRLYLNNKHLVSDVEHDYIVSGGNPVEAIVESAINHRADFIFMGKDKPGLSSVLTGDVTQKVIEQSPVPVIVVEGIPQEAKAIQ